MSGWDADRYQRQFGFVSVMAGGVLELLDASPGEVGPDLGRALTAEVPAALLPQVLARVDELAAARRPVVRRLLAAAVVAIADLRRPGRRRVPAGLSSRSG